MNREWSFGLIGLLAGIALATIALSVSTLKLNPDIRVTDVVNLTLTIAIALYVKDYVQQRFTNVRIEKDLLIGTAKQTLLDLQTTRRSFVDAYKAGAISHGQGVELLTNLRSVANGFTSLEETVKTTPALRVPSENRDAAKAAYLRYKAIVTGDAFPEQPYDAAAYGDQERAFTDVSQCLTTYILDINRS